MLKRNEDAIVGNQVRNDGTGALSNGMEKRIANYFRGIANYFRGRNDQMCVIYWM